MTEYDDAGGSAAVKAAVTVFYNRVLADPQLAPWFNGVDLSRLRAHQRAFLTMALAGPEIFAGRDLRTVHAGLEISDEAFDAMIAHLATALGDVGMADDTVTSLMARIETERARIVTVPASTS